MELFKGTSLIQPYSVEFDLEAGIMKNPRNYTGRRASDMRGHYRDTCALERLIVEGDPLHYEVFECLPPGEYGHIFFCISKLMPGKVGDEYFMTKGHYHTVQHTGELYLCLRGTGFMLMKTADGQFASQPFHRGAMVYCPPYWAHRSVNIGSEPLISFCSYNAEAGHNYGDIEKEGFMKRVREIDGVPVIL
ncbi:MAG: glucose-6-phosphate isomerase family protein [Rectinemataceae bacterium]|nr:glucose-6-phosphate isomerase family protein [Rectinemataceae bacterium]